MNPVEDFVNVFYSFFVGITFLIFIVLGIRKLAGVLDEAKRFEELRAQAVTPPKKKDDEAKHFEELRAQAVMPPKKKDNVCKKQEDWVHIWDWYDSSHPCRYGIDVNRSAGKITFWEYYGKMCVGGAEDTTFLKDHPTASADDIIQFVCQNYFQIETPVANQDLPMDIEQSVAILRNQIILRITGRPADEYELASLLWNDAASCFPCSGRSFQWDSAHFMLDLKKHTLSARVSTYPNQFGASFEEKIPLSASKFHQIAVQYHMDNYLQVFQTDNDWAMLFDDKLNEAISLSCTMLQKKKQEQKRMYAVKLPQNSGNVSPNMDIIEITLELHQRFSDSTVQVKNENGKYRIIYTWVSNTSSDTSRHSRTLSVKESVWLEKRLKEVIENPDMSLWQSLYGGDWMNIQIKRANCKDISLRTMPIRKYSDLETELSHLTEYGSQKV